MKEKIILSIIVPIYNGENYLDRCVKAIIQEYQTGVDLLLVNDGSEDRSLDRCNDWKDIHEWIRVLHHKNQGVSYTRNRGIEAAKGNYVWFVDVDDIILPGSIASIVEVIENEKPDVLLFGYRSRLARKQLNEFDTNPSEQIRWMDDKLEEGIFWELFARNLIHNIGNKVYLKELLIRGNVRFDERLAIFEDAIFCVNAMKLAGNLSVYADSWYCYYLEDNIQSLNHIYRKNYFFGVLLLYERIREITGESDMFYNYFLKSILDVIRNEFRRSGFCYNEFRKFIEEILSDNMIQQTINQMDKYQLEKIDKRWKKILNRHFLESYILFWGDNLKRNILELKIVNNLFDILYYVYKHCTFSR